MVRRYYYTCFKKGDPDDPNNYHGISLISFLFFCLHIVYLNIKPMVHLMGILNDVLRDAQLGFQPILGTTEAVFVLHCLVT